MKKILIALTITLSCLGISRVNAEILEFTHSDWLEYNCDFLYTDYDYIKELGFEDEIQELYNLLMQEYNVKYSSDYPYFHVKVTPSDSKNCNTSSTITSIERIYLDLFVHKEIPILGSVTTNVTDNRPIYISPSDFMLRAIYNVTDSVYITSYIENQVPSSPFYSHSYYSPLQYFISNFDLFNRTEYTYVVTGNSNFTINPGDVIKPVFTVGNAFQNNYTEINLNDYSYVALALKDYNQEPFSTQVYVKGNYCLTPVYNYGMTERKDILTGTQVDRCSPYYESYTPVRTYITESDLKNHSIYYLKSYDTSKDNYIKVDTSIFDITYITEENKENPYVTIGGKTYPTISYDKLTDTSTKSEDEDYVSGAVEEFSFSDIFTAPLEFLKDIWGSIVSVFDLVKEFFSLLPEPIPTFLLTSFMLAVALGLLKIIL